MTANIYYMAINEWKIWQSLGITKKKEEYVDVAKDLSAVVTFIRDETPILRKLLDMSVTMQELRKKEIQLKEQNAPDEDLRRILIDEIKLYDEILKLYEFYSLDVGVNGARLKKVAKVFKKKALETNVQSDVMEAVKKSDRWNFNW